MILHHTWRDETLIKIKIMIENGKVETNLYIKPINLQLYLHFFSNHPEPCKIELFMAKH